MERGVSAEVAAIAREAQMRSEASEAARIAYVMQARTLRERRGCDLSLPARSAAVASDARRGRNGAVIEPASGAPTSYWPTHRSAA